MKLLAILREAWIFAKENSLALFLLIWNFEEYKLQRANRKSADLMLELQLEKNKNEVENEFAGKSVDDIIRDDINGRRK